VTSVYFLFIPEGLVLFLSLLFPTESRIGFRKGFPKADSPLPCSLFFFEPPFPPLMLIAFFWDRAGEDRRLPSLPFSPLDEKTFFPEKKSTSFLLSPRFRIPPVEKENGWSGVSRPLEERNLPLPSYSFCRKRVAPFSPGHDPEDGGEFLPAFPLAGSSRSSPSPLSA